MLFLLNEVPNVSPYSTNIISSASLSLDFDTSKDRNQTDGLEQYMYRLRVCPELCLGLFSTVPASPDLNTGAALDAARIPDSSSPDHKSVLIGHVIGTLTASPTITDESMKVALNPSPAQIKPESTSESIDSSALSPKLGHDDLGRTLAIHSVSVLPQFQHKDLGKILLKSYLQRMEGAKVADHAAIIVHPELAGWYVRNFGFEDKGPSPVKLGDGEWKQLVSFVPPTWSLQAL